MSFKRRQFLLFLGAAAGTTAVGVRGQGQSLVVSQTAQAASPPGGFLPLQGPLPYEGIGLADVKQLDYYSRYQIQDDLVLPQGYTYDVIASWGDPLGDSRVGYNNDYLSFVPTGPDEGYLTVNFEYISADTWSKTLEPVTGKVLPFAEVAAALEAQDGEVNAFELPDDDPLKAQIREISKEALLDQGLGVISVRRDTDGRWVRTNSDADRRISGISGLEDDRYLRVTGPAAAVFIKQTGQGYMDSLGAFVIGSFGNCAGGTTPWGTALSAEENFQDQVPEAVYADGTAFLPREKAFDDGIDGQGNVLGLSCNKYGWIVEVDPSNPDDFGTKHSWLGRYRHEAVGIRVEAGSPLAFYSGCDRRGGHVYKFVSSNPVTNPQDKANSQLLADGMLYAAKFNPDGSGTWIPLTMDTAVDPVLPSTVVGGMVTLPNRPEGGFIKVEDDAVAQAMKQQYGTLGDLYEGSDLEKQGAILIDAHFAASAAGSTTTARPEDTMVAPDGTLFIAFTSGLPGGDGGPDTAIFQGPNGEEEYEYGWIMKLMEDSNDPAAMSFQWEMFAAGGEPAEGGLGFSNPDNLEFDAKGNLWMVTDMSTSAHNQPVPARINEQGETLSQKELLGIFGNNAIWQIPTTGDRAGSAYLFGYGPMECEMTGPYFTPDNTTLFLSAQHPGEVNGQRQAMAAETRSFAMQTTDGVPFIQAREVPIGSNWPGKNPNDPPKPSVVAVRRLDGEPLS